MQKTWIQDIKRLIDQIGSQGYRDGSSTKKGYTYHPIPIKGFEDVPVHKRDQCKKEYALIKKVIKEKNITPNKVLDIGANLGFFSFNFQRDFEAKITAVEKDSLNATVLKAIIQHQFVTDKIELFDGDIKDYLKSSDQHFDVCLLLNVHMWVYKQHGSKSTKDIMKNLSETVEHLFFQTAHTQSSGMFLIREMKTVNDVHKYLLDVGFTNVQKVFESRWHGGKNRTLFYARGKAK